jgi:hypothetical protein
MTNAKRNSLGKQLAAMSEEERDDWAFDLLQDDLTDEDVIALDILGWKIVEKEPGGSPPLAFRQQSNRL